MAEKEEGTIMWHPITEEVGYFKGAVNQGIIHKDSNCILVDTGLDRQAARKLIRLLGDLQLKPIAIINTHAHADHFGGNAEILSHYGNGIRVYAPIFEESAIRYPIWEPTYLYSGAYPLPDLENKFLFAPESPVHVIYEAGILEIGDFVLQAIPLYGHSFRQMGISYDHVLLSADAFYGREVLEKHPLPFHVDTKETLLTLNNLIDAPYSTLVPGHGAAISCMEERRVTIMENKAVYDRVNQLICTILSEPMTLDQLQASLLGKLGLDVMHAGSYLLYKTAIMAQLKYLSDSQVIFYQIQDNQWLWRV